MIRGMFRDTSGGVATMAGMMFAVIAAASGAALDYTNASNRRTELHAVADASVLAAASPLEATNEERIEIAKKTFLGSYFCRKHGCVEPNVTMNGTAVVMTADMTVKTSLLAIIGMDGLDVSIHSEATPPSGIPLDVVMMLDYSGSMNSSNKYQDMADAASQFLDQAAGVEGDYISVGLVPFSKYVLAPLDGDYVYDMDAGEVLSGQSVVGCMLNREYPHSASSATPNSSQQGSLWPTASYAIGSNPQGSGLPDDYSPTEYPEQDINFTYNGSDYTIRYVDTQPNSGLSAPTLNLGGGDDDDDDDGSDTVDGGNELAMTWVGAATLAIEFRNVIPWDQRPAPSPLGGYAGSDGWTTGIDGGLPATFDTHQLSEDLGVVCGDYVTRRLWARPLSQDFSGMKQAIQAMRPAGLTNISLALDFGWHMLTSPAPFSEASTEQGTKRVAILLTDGVQTVKAHGPTAGGGTESSKMAANAVTAEACETMKAENIEIFTIAFDIDDDYTRGLLQDCASGEPHYFEAGQGGDLSVVFGKILQKILVDRVRLTG